MFKLNDDSDSKPPALPKSTFDSKPITLQDGVFAVDPVTLDIAAEECARLGFPLALPDVCAKNAIKKMPFAVIVTTSDAWLNLGVTKDINWGD